MRAQRPEAPIVPGTVVQATYSVGRDDVDYTGIVMDVLGARGQNCRIAWPLYYAERPTVVPTKSLRVCAPPDESSVTEAVRYLSRKYPSTQGARGRTLSVKRMSEYAWVLFTFLPPFARRQVVNTFPQALHPLSSSGEVTPAARRSAEFAVDLLFRFNCVRERAPARVC